MINNVVLVGRLTKDPELRYTPSGKAVAGFTLAVNRRFSNQQGEREADFIDIVVWGKTAETCANFLAKGRLAGVEGRLQIRNYETKDGEKRKAAEVVAENVTFLDKGTKSGSAPSTAGNHEEPDNGNDAKQSDDVPF